jgi:4-hydroxy-tetrahydrodipicolinate synthase
MTHDHLRPFGRLVSAMVTPFTPDGSLDADGAARLATWLVDEQGHDALVLSGTGGESPTTTDAEKETLLRIVVEAVGDRARIVAGVGTNNTAHTVELARSAEKAGAHGLLVVTPYCSGVPIATETLVRLAEHPGIVAVKDAKGDIAGSADVLRRTDLAYYSGEDSAILPLLSIGAVGVVGTSTHFIGPQTKAMIEAFERGDNAGALALHRQLLPLFTGIFRTQGTILVKAGLRALGLPAGPVRSPLVDATEAETNQLLEDAAAAGLHLGTN